MVTVLRVTKKNVIKVQKVEAIPSTSIESIPCYKGETTRAGRVRYRNKWRLE